MNSPMITELLEIQKLLAKYDGKSRVDLYAKFIDEKLATSLLTYKEDLEKSTVFLEGQNSNRVIKAISKLAKNRDREIIDQNLTDRKESYD